MPTAWDDWAASGTSASTEDTWINWNTSATTTFTTAGAGNVTGVPTPTPTPEEIQRREEQQRIQLEAAAKQEEERCLAKRAAKLLLLKHLTNRQRQELKQHKFFTVESGNRLYQIGQGRSQNVKLLDSAGRVLKTYCIHPSEFVPDEDTMLAQKLFIEHCEDDFLKIANAS